MRSKLPIIPGDLVFSRENFQKRLDFAKKVGNSIHADVVNHDFVDGEGLPLDKWPVLDLEYSEAHLMVRKPMDYLETAKEKNVTRAIVHVEAAFELMELAAKARELDLLLGFAINLDTDLTKIKPFFEVSNYFQVMGIVPGATGRKQDPQAGLAVSYLRKTANRRLIISVDGGVNEENIPRLKDLGADYFVASSALYDRGDWEENFKKLLAATEAQTVPVKLGNRQE